MNPKDKVGLTKAQMHLIPGPAQRMICAALADGVKKYGAFNWRGIPIHASQYLAALERHVKDWQDGEDNAPDSEHHHLAHAAATLIIMLDALECGTLVDDRPRPIKGARRERRKN